MTQSRKHLAEIATSTSTSYELYRYESDFATIPPIDGVATLFRVTLFRGDISPMDKIPPCQESEETLVRGGHDSEVPLVRGDMSPEGTSFRGDIPFEKIPRSLNFPPAGNSTDYSTDYSCVGCYFSNWQMSLVIFVSFNMSTLDG